MLYKQSPQDRKLWVDLLSLSAEEESYIDETVEAGDGLLIFGGLRIPIMGRFPDNNEIYELISTNPTERAERLAAQRFSEAVR
jgi:hypothetical protein